MPQLPNNERIHGTNGLGTHRELHYKLQVNVMILKNLKARIIICKSHDFIGFEFDAKGIFYQGDETHLPNRIPTINRIHRAHFD